MVFELFPEVAPKHVAQVAKLAAADLYDSTRFARLEKGFVLQVSTVQDRLTPLSAEQEALVRRIPAEFSSLPHKRGVLSMARADDDPDSAESSFSILLGDAPHLDGRYTVFGRLVSGSDALDALEEEAVTGNTPLRRLTIAGIDLVDEAGGGSNKPRVADLAKGINSGSAQPNETAPTSFVAGILGLAILGGGAVKILSGHARPETVAATGLLISLTAGFGAWVALFPTAQRSQGLAAALFLGVLCLMRLMSNFENPSEHRPRR